MQYFAGIDIGSTAIKIVLTDQEQRLAATCTAATGSHFHKNAATALAELLQSQDIKPDQIACLVSTGYGRKLFREADETVSEITANAMGASRVGTNAARQIRTIINIGGQDLKIIRLDAEGHVNNFAMNDKCAAGTGRFLEMTARNLELDVEELGELHLAATGLPLAINSTCTVFAESEIISLLANGYNRAEVVAGVHYSIARRVARLAKRLTVEDTVLFDGGPALNQGLVQALEDELMRPVLVPAAPQLTTAYGAALLALEIFTAREPASNAA